MAAPQSGFGIVSFSHVHWYVDSLKAVEEYSRLQDKLNEFEKLAHEAIKGDRADTAEGRRLWLSLQEKHGDPSTGPSDPAAYKPQAQDVVEQLLVGLGWRITGVHAGATTSSVVVKSRDPDGVKFVITAPNPPVGAMAALGGFPQEEFHHFDIRELQRYASCHIGRQGGACLGFVTGPGGVDAITAKYREKHPKMVLAEKKYPGARILEVAAYYKGEKLVTEPDIGTVLRFVEYTGEDVNVLPGVSRVEATYCNLSQGAYCDHWVSNVFDRQGVLDVLEDTLGFSPKVNFNAGVVAAGEAQIESTVTGNTSAAEFNDPAMMLTDQSQVYLPTNNALSEVGHVHLFLKEVGQGVQHIASRVKDLTTLIQRANDYRLMTGAGLSFLQIPKSYYGFLNASRLAKNAGIEPALAEKCHAQLRQAGVVSDRDLVDLDVTEERVAEVLAAVEGADAKALVPFVMRARYGNIYALCKDIIDERTYMRIVRNNILVDVQGEDMLMQIFTSNILQRKEGQEAPFLEFIQRVCSAVAADGCDKNAKIAPGCGGFGIRNFLTLFLSIEVSKAVNLKADAEAKGDAATAAMATKQVDAFTAQLDESNPVLTAISDAMTAEGFALERGDKEAAARHDAEKAKGQERLKEISNKYKGILKGIREGSL